MKIISWNVNGLRAVLKKDFLEFLRKDKPDVLCLQEIKIDRDAIKLAEFDFPGYEEFYNPAERKGYSGTAVLIRADLKIKPKYLNKLAWDDEGRVQVFDLGGFYLVNVYFPNANAELSRLDFKLDFNERLLEHLKELERAENVTSPAKLRLSTPSERGIIVCGDFNVAHNEIDLARPRENEGQAGFHPRERDWMNRFLAAGFVDTFRFFHPETAKYSWWSYRAGARQKNVGWRIDYFCVSESLMKKMKKAFIQNEVLGSDHCPVGVEID